MTAVETPCTSLSATPANQQTEPPASLPQRYADWTSYAAAQIQQAAPTAANFAPAEG